MKSRNLFRSAPPRFGIEWKFCPKLPKVVQEVALSRPALCEVIPFARGHGDKHILALSS